MYKSKFARLSILICFLLLPNSLFADNEGKVDFLNNPELLSNSFDEFKGVKLEINDKRIIDSECSELMNKDYKLYKDCQLFYKKLALSFKVDSLLCKKKAKRLKDIKKQEKLVLIDEGGNIRTFTIKEAPFSEDEEYEKCMDNMQWKDSSDFRYGKY